MTDKPRDDQKPDKHEKPDQLEDKLKDAEKHGVRVLSEDEWLVLIG